MQQTKHEAFIATSWRAEKTHFILLQCMQSIRHSGNCLYVDREGGNSGFKVAYDPSFSATLALNPSPRDLGIT